MNSAFKALPGDIISNHVEELLSVLRVTHRLWKEARDFDFVGSQMMITTIYICLNNFAIALDNSDEFELSQDIGLKRHILDSIMMILEDLFHFESIRGAEIGVNYLRSFKSWLSYANYHIGHEKVDELLGKFIDRIKKDRQFIHHSNFVVEIIKVLVVNRKTLDEIKCLFKLNSFKQLFELLRRDEHKLEISKFILETIRANLKLNYNLKSKENSIHCDESSTKIEISDKILINFIFKLSSTINDSLSLLAADDDIEHNSKLIIYFLDKISIPDFREHLDFFSRCRGSLGNLVDVLEYLAREVLKLAIEFRKTNLKRNSRRDFMNGCLAFTFITIPALNCPNKRLDLFIEGSKLALNYMSLSLADYYMKQALMNLKDQLEPKQNRSSPTNDNYSEFAQLNQGLAEKSINNNIGGEMTNKLLVNQVRSLLDLMIKFEDHIDLKHKLLLSDLIKKILHNNSDLIEQMKLLNIIGEED